MTLIRKLFILCAMATLSAPLACNKDAAKKDQAETPAAITALLDSIEMVELSDARGLLLDSSTPETRQVFKRVLTRSKIAAGLLRNDESSLDGLTELVRSRDELRNILFLSEDVDTVGVYRTALEKAVKDMCTFQSRNAFDLGDPNVYRALYSQTFDLQQKLGDFSTFVETKTSRGPKLFEAGTCGDACGKMEFIIADVNKSQSIWLLSPKIDLPNTEGLKMTLGGSSKGDVSNTSMKGFRVFVSESFDGRFKGADEWTDVTALLDRYPANGTSFKTFTSTIALDSLRGKSVSFAFRFQGVTTSTTAYEIQSFAINGKGLTSKTNLNLVAPEPLLLSDEVSPPPVNNPPTTTPVPTQPTPTGPIYDAITKACEIGADGAYDVSSSCLISLVDITSAEDGTPAAASPYRKFNYDAGKSYAVTAPRSGWRGNGCNAKPTNTDLLKGFCVERSAAVTWDMLVTPKIKMSGRYTIKIWHAPLGPTLNAPSATIPAINVVNRFRVLTFDEVTAAAKLQMTDASGAAADFIPDNGRYDVPFSNYPLVETVELNAATLMESTLDRDALATKSGAKPFRLALFQNLNGLKKTASSAWYVYAITFKAEN